MSDISSRPVGGPPKRATKAPASSLLKKNRPQSSFASSAAAEPEQTSTVAASVETAPSEAVGESMTPEAFLDRPDAAVSATAAAPVAVEHRVSEVRAPEPAAAVQPVAVEALAPPSQPAQEDALVNTTFRVRRSSKKAFDAAFIAAKLHEGWPSAEAYFQDLLERETKRIQDSYNNGQPFPLRDKALPRGRPIGS